MMNEYRKSSRQKLISPPSIMLWCVYYLLEYYSVIVPHPQIEVWVSNTLLSCHLFSTRLAGHESKLMWARLLSSEPAASCMVFNYSRVSLQHWSMGLLPFSAAFRQAYSFNPTHGQSTPSTQLHPVLSYRPYPGEVTAEAGLPFR